MIAALVLGLVLVGQDVAPAAPCRALYPRPEGTESVFVTERECRLYRVVVQLEIELRTATTAAARYRSALERLAGSSTTAPAAELAAELGEGLDGLEGFVDAPAEPVLDWRRPVLVVGASSLGGGLGAAVFGSSPPAGALVGALALGALAWLVDEIGVFGP